MNYKLIKLMWRGVGLVLGTNKYESKWFEIRWHKTIITVFIVNNNPCKARYSQGDVTVVSKGR